MVDMRWLTGELRSISWHHEGKQFMCSHVDGTLTTWNIKTSSKYIHISQPHGKLAANGFSISANHSLYFDSLFKTDLLLIKTSIL